MEQQSNKRPRRMVFQNLTAILTAIWYMASKAFYFCDANFFSIVYFFSIIPALFSIVIFTCLFIILQETLVHKEKESIVSWTSDVNCARQEIVFVFPIGMVRVKLIKSQSSIRIREQRSPSVVDWTKMYHNPLQAKWTGEAGIC